MANAVWTGSLSLGLVVVPVRLYPAIRKKNVRFHELDGGGRRVRHVRVSEPDFEFAPAAAYLTPPPLLERAYAPHVPDIPIVADVPEIGYQEIRKGYEV